MREIVSDLRSCTGCSACSQACPEDAIKMKENEEGFLYPSIDEDKCIECGLCRRICPVNNASRNSAITGKKAFACYAKNDEIRTASSSGGVFSQLAIKTLEKNGVVFGAGFDEGFRVRHCYIDNIDELDGLRRSKYVQSDIENTYREAGRYLDEGRNVLFCGTPCQIAGLKAYLRKGYDNLLTCDLACFGVPSPSVWSMYLDYLRSKYNSDIDYISFRNKSGGWKDYRMDISFMNGSRYLVQAKKELYFIGFGKNIFNRSSCFDCRFRIWNSSADITLADFWGIEKMNGMVEDDNRGVSLVITHNGTGEAALNSIGDDVFFKECGVNEAVKYNPRLVTSAAEPAGRSAFFADMCGDCDFERLRRKYMDNTSVKYKVKYVIKRILGKG